MSILVVLPGALGRSLRLRRQPAPAFPTSDVSFGAPPAMSATSMLAFGGMAINPMTTEQLESLPNPGDMSRMGVGDASVATLEASFNSGPEPPPPLVEDGSTPAVANDAPAPDDDNIDPEAEGFGDPPADGAVKVLDPELQSLMPAAPIDMMARATQESDRQTALIRQAQPPKTPPLVSMVVCAKAAKQLKAMSCSLVTQISGYPEGCECRMKASKCPAVRRDLGFTGVSPSIPLSAGGTTVILCMYWQWLKPQDRSAENAAAAVEAKEAALSLYKSANVNAENGAKAVAIAYYSMTPAPTIITSTAAIPATPAPIYEPVRIMSTTPAMPFFPMSMWGPAPGPAPGPATTYAPPFMPMFGLNPFAEAMSTLLFPVAAWATVLPIASNMGFLLGREIIIDAGTGLQESNFIVNFGSIYLKYPLKFNHAAGAKIIMPRLGAPGPAPGPSPGPMSPAGMWASFWPGAAGPGPAPAPAPFVR